MRCVDVVVVGGGAMGSAAARSLGEHGLQVVLLERFQLGHARGSSRGATRIFRLAYPDPEYVELCRRALQAWRRLERRSGERLVLSTGGLDAGPEAEQCAGALAACGVAHEWLPADEAASRFPWLSLDGHSHVLFHPGAGVSLSERTIAVQARLASSSGVEVRDRTEVRTIAVDRHGVRIETTAEEFQAPVAVVTAGGWSEQLLAGAGCAVSLATTLTHVAYFRRRSEVPITTFVETDPARPGWYAYLVPEAGEAPGVKLGQWLGAQRVDPDAGPFEVDEAWTAAHVEYVRRRLPGLEPVPIATETCLYASTADDDFVLERRGPLVLGVGFGGHGFKFTPLIGELLAALALGEQPEFPAARFSALRPAVSQRLPVKEAH